jgi:hypothetical protein
MKEANVSLRPLPGSPTAKLDREAVVNYQVAYLVNRFAISAAQARIYIERFGVGRRELTRAVLVDLGAGQAGN